MPDVYVIPVRVRRNGERVTVKRINVYAATNYGDDPEELTVPEAQDLIKDLQAAITKATNA